MRRKNHENIRAILAIRNIRDEKPALRTENFQDGGGDCFRGRAPRRNDRKNNIRGAYMTCRA